MAKIFRRQRTLHPIAELNVTNMIDLGFTLLIIFMIAATSLVKHDEQTVPVNLPEQDRQEQAKAPANAIFVSVTIDSSGRYSVDGRSVSASQLDKAFTDYSAAPKDKQPVFRIRGDGDSQWQQVARVMSLMEKHGLTKISIDYQVPP
jgi:biopolymer transport protein ExbD